LRSLIGGIERRTPGKIKYQTHKSTYRKRENLILNLNQRTPSTFGYQTVENRVPEVHEKTTSCQRKLDRKIITFSRQTLLIKLVVRKM
jgi:hypothetical protein